MVKIAPLVYSPNKAKENFMCGIVGYAGKRKASEILLDELKRIEYRGYDSAGVAILNKDGKTSVIKSVGAIVNLEKKIATLSSLDGDIGIGHTRWATHGSPSEINAHPHFSDDHNVIGVHNGIIENYKELKEKLLSKGYSFYSETDTEVLIKLIDYYYKKYSLGPLDAINKALVRARGTYAIALLFKERPGQIWFARKGSPLVIGKGKEENFLASDASALVQYTDEVYYVDDYECGYIEGNKVAFFDLNGNDITSRKKLVKISYKADEASKGNYHHYMLKEIYEQPKAIRDTLAHYWKDGHIDFEDTNLSEEELASYKRIYIVACGSAYHTGVAAQYLFEDLCAIPVRVELASEFKYRNLPLEEDSLAIFVSQSGETRDTEEALLKAKAHRIKTLAIVNVLGSTIARDADATLYTYAGPEIAVATTKAYSCQLLVFYLLALKMAHSKKKIDEKKYSYYLSQIVSIPEAIERILKDISPLQRLASEISLDKDVFFIGRGLDYALGLEGSLKLKEISYIHSEAFAAGELKHGTIALIDKKVSVVALLTQEELMEKTISNALEVKAREGKIIALTYEGTKLDNKLAENWITIPHIDNHFAISLAVIPLQLLAYYVSLSKGIDPDKPRNLAKSVTVE